MKCRFLLVAAILFLSSAPAIAQKQFGFDNRKASGQPYLSPEESLKRLKVPPGWEVKLVAAEPDVVNPVAFTIDERGRIWVLECFEYPKRTPKGKKPRDRIKIIEEDPKGGPPKVTVWADGQTLPIGWDLATGLEVGHGGAFLGAPPYLFFLKDTDGDGKADKQEILLKGFGSQDTHETLNTLQWGPDSKLYGLHGVFTQSDVDGVKMNAAVWRYDVRSKKFDIFAEGTSNPWGMDFDARGQCFIAGCVIPHLFHMVPGGTYKRQAGSSYNPYAYGLLNEISDHLHHQQSGWAHAGLLVLEGDHVPEAYRGSVLMGSIHGCSIKRDVLRPNGSSFIASCAPDFLTSEDKNFRPINLRWGPDGSIYVIDWHDQNPCHQTKPDDWDYERGRIYKIQRTGAKAMAPVDLFKASTAELVGHLANSNPWWYRTALRLWGEKPDQRETKLLAPLLDKPSEEQELRALWAVAATGIWDPNLAPRRTSAILTAWWMRHLSDHSVNDDEWVKSLPKHAASTSPVVRLQLASTARQLSKHDTLPILQGLMKRPEDAKDPCIPLMIWLALEPKVLPERDRLLDWLSANAAGNALISNEIVPRVMRRLVDVAKPDEHAAAWLGFLVRTQDASVRRPALEGLLQSLKDRTLDPPGEWAKTYVVLQQDKDAKVEQLTRRLAIHFQDRAAQARTLNVVRDVKADAQQRVQALRDLATAPPPGAMEVFMDLVSKDTNLEVRREACRALSAFDSPAVPKTFLSGGWKKLPPPVQQELVNVLSGRKAWAQELLTAIGIGHVSRTDLTDNTILRIRAFKDAQLNKVIESVWGRYRETPKDLDTLITKMRGHMHDGSASFARGKLVFDNQCAKCHKFDGRGHDVGPNLDGAARDIEYLLANILDPNRVIGQPYYMRTVELKNGRIETGLLHAEDDQAITLKMENDVQKVIRKTEIDGIQVQEKSVMPEGLANNMTVQDFRDLVRYVMAHPFVTEVEMSAGASGRIQTPVVGPAGRIALPASKTDNEMQIRADVHSPAAIQTRLLLGGSHAIEVRLNDKVIYKGRPSKSEATPDQHAVDVNLLQGANRLVVTVIYRGDNEAIYARLLDPDRKLRYGDSK